MSLPTNSNYTKEGCSPTSSNCVVWQGPNIECIDLCKGDSITEVTFKLAEELCSLLNLVDVSAYEFGCLNLPSDPDDLKDLIETLTARICSLEGGEVVVPGEGGPLPIMTLSSCLQYEFPINSGEIITELPLDEYVTLLGGRLCTVISDIVLINTTLDDHETRIDALETAGGGGGSSNTILSGGVDPTPIIGSDGDFYINTTSLQIFGPKSAGLWGSGTDIVGADGIDGNGIASIVQTGGTGAPGTTDEYTITLDDASTFVFDIYNGADGAVIEFDNTGTVIGSLPTAGFNTGDVYIVKYDSSQEIKYFKFDGAAWQEEMVVPYGAADVVTEAGPNSYLFKANKTISQNLKDSGTSNTIFVNFEDDSTNPPFFDNNNVWTQFSWEPDQVLTNGPNFIVENLQIETNKLISGGDLDVQIQFVKVNQTTGLVTSTIGSLATITIPDASAEATQVTLPYFESGSIGAIGILDNVDIRLRAYVLTSGYVAGDIQINSGIIYNQN